MENTIAFCYNKKTSFCWTMYNTCAIILYLNYCIIVWGSKICTDHRLHLLQKEVVRTITKKDYNIIAHTV